MAPGGSARPETDLLQSLIAGQAQAAARFDEVFKRLDKAEGVASEARDVAREIVTILREQDALARVAEVKAEARQMVADLRQDVVRANTLLKDDLVKAAGRIDVLEDGRIETNGMAKGAKLLWEGAKLIIAAGGGAALAKLFGGH